MKRIIKFRAWDRDYKIMEKVHCLTFDFPENGQTESKNLNSYWYKQNNIILMQYTGLKDKNGVEVYEGDIVRYAIIEESWKVIWKKYGWCFKLSDGDEYNIPVTNLVKVIGNIYENPELLK